MSSICGIFSLDESYINQETSVAMMEELCIHKTDFSNTWNKDQVFFGCNIQYITPESVNEKLPYYDSESNMTITADAIIDNRDELFHKLGLHLSNHKEAKKIPDSLLILKAYQRWGKESPTHLLGDFAFAIWDGKKRELFCGVDHTGTRTFYYYASSKVFAFSTLMKPLFALQQITTAYSEEWICDYLAIPSVIHQLDSELTIYKDIRILPAGHTLTVSKQGISKKVYWKVKKPEELKLRSDQDYEEAFRYTLGQAVSCRIRSLKPVGIMLSGGLDSTSVACLAAKELNESGKSLQAFSSIPIEGYHNSLPANKIANETPYIEAVRACFRNIEVTYCRFEGKHALSDVERYNSVLEQPYKILENLFWINGILAQAKDRDVGIMLTGGIGNTTISYGVFRQCLISLMRSGKWIQLIKEIGGYSALKKSNPLRITFELIKSFLPYEVQKTWYKKRNSNWDAPLRLSPINPKFADQMDSNKRFKKFNYDPLYIKQLDSLEYRQMMLSPANLSHLAGIYTKLSLAHNMVMRDPTMDKRVIEFCLSVPDEQYIRNGRGRYLLRRAMKGILPDKVRLNYQERGQQSADFVQRLRPIEQGIIEEIRKIGQHELERKYLDVERILKGIKEIDMMGEKAYLDYEIRMLLRSIIFSRYVNLPHLRYR